MNIAIISECHLMGIYIVKEIRHRFPHALLIRPVSDPSSNEVQAQIPRQSENLPRRVVDWVHREFYRRLNRRMEEQLAWEIFGTRAKVPLPEHTQVVYGEINRPEGEALLSSGHPDVIVTAGAPILRPSVLGIPSRACLNLHWGISPEYRGNHTIFQALRRRDYRHIGLTLHHIDPGIDTGPLIAHVYPSLDRYDTEATILAKCTLIGAGVLLEALRVLEVGTLAGVPQLGLGTNYRRRDRRLRHDLKLLLHRRLLWRGVPESPERIVRYFEAPSDASQAGTGDSG